jgi:hypothetical protein
MNPTETTLHSERQAVDPGSAATRKRSILHRVLTGSQFGIALGLTVAFLVYLVFFPPRPAEVGRDASRPGVSDIVQVAGRGLLHIQPGTPLDDKLEINTARLEKITIPVLPVTGRVVASLRPGNHASSDYWQFETPDELTAYTDMQKAQADVAFTQKQLDQIKKLAETRSNAQQQVVARLQKTVALGTTAQKELITENANLLQYQIQGQKDVYEAENAFRVAKRNAAACARQLQQTGLEPSLLQSARSDIDIVLAEVPEAKSNRVKVGQSCQARFFGIPDQVFNGKINIVSPVVSKERRTLRVLFSIEDPKDQLRPGMYAEIGLGTDPRNAVMVPAEGILHIGRDDYALVAAGPNTWRVTEVQVGEPHNDSVEIQKGIKPDDRMMGKGTILLKPLVVRALLPVDDAPTKTSRITDRRQ